MTDHRTLGQLGEFGLIERISAALAVEHPVLLGPGDDAAQIAVREQSVVMSTDLLVENRHFRREWSSAEDIGRKSAACTLSDINAMGGTASALTIGLCAPAELPVAWVEEFIAGFLAECALVGAQLVGGDVTAGDQIVIAVTAIGEVARPVRRDGAMPGDVVAYAGILGMGGAGFAALSRGFRSPRAAVDAHRVPMPPYAAGPQAAAAGATAMIDVSDGLLADLGHVARASGVTIDLDASALTVFEPVQAVAQALGADPLTFVLTGGDDYALVATFSQATELPDGWTRIGTVADVMGPDGPGVTVDGATWQGATGHQHFR